MGEDVDLSVLGGPGLSAVREALSQALDAAGIRHEILILGDAGSDGFAAALAASRGRYVVTLGPRCDVAPDALLELWRARDLGDLLTASLVHELGAAGPLARRLLVLFFARCLGLPVRDLSSPVRLSHGGLLRAQPFGARGPALASELLVQLYAEGWRVCGGPGGGRRRGPPRWAALPAPPGPPPAPRPPAP